MSEITGNIANFAATAHPIMGITCHRFGTLIVGRADGRNLDPNFADLYGKFLLNEIHSDRGRRFQNSCLIAV